MRDTHAQVLHRASALGKTVAAILLWGVVTLSGQGQTGSPETVYQLKQDTTFEQGCFPPCECPVMISSAVRGTFVLKPTGFDGLFDTYAVEDVNWVVSAVGGSDKLVTGKGTYKVGGEFALQQEFSLFLQIDGAAAERFDSGLVPGEARFPDIKATVSTNGLVCLDTVFGVSASPMRLMTLASGANIILMWPTNIAGFTLQSTTNLTASAVWTPVSLVPAVLNGQNEVINPVSGTQRFYRLSR